MNGRKEGMEKKQRNIGSTGKRKKGINKMESENTEER